MRRAVGIKVRGYSLLEISVIGVIVLLLLAVAFSRYTQVQARAEDAARQAVLDSLHTELTLRAAQIALHEGASHVSVLEQRNPFELLAEKPGNYAGEPPLSGNLSSAHWYYAPVKREIIYARHWNENTFPSPDGARIERYRIAVQFGAGGVDGVVLKAVAVANDQER